MIKAIIFDCFGVIITDSLSVMLDEVRLVDSNKADRILDYTERANKGLLDTTEARRAIAAELGISLDEYIQKLFGNGAKNHALLDYIKTLKKDYKIAMLSNVSQGGLEDRFRKAELAEHFDVVVASFETGFAKPQAQAYEITADKLGVRCDECIMIDDRQDYCEGARATGMQAILYQSLATARSEIESIL